MTFAFPTRPCAAVARCIAISISASCFALALPCPATSQVVVRGSKRSAHASADAGELRAAHAFDAAKQLGSPELYAFLKPMPKGADLHMHLSGAVYAESFIDEAIRAGLCVAPVERGSPPVPTGQDAVRFVAPDREHDGACKPGSVPASDAEIRQPLYDSLIDSFSMRAFVPTEGIDGHDQFFATFERFGGLKNEFAGEWLDEVATRAASQNEQYLEIMQTPSFVHAANLGYKLGWPADVNDSSYKVLLAKLRNQLLSAGVLDEVAIDVHELADAQAARRKLESCDAAPPLTAAPLPPAASSASAGSGESSSPKPEAGCAVQVRWLYQILRGFPPEQVFAQTLLGFAAATVDPTHIVGINFVMPEDGLVSMRDYHLQMLMVDYLHSVYPTVHISLHAGEIGFGMVPPHGLTFHIREAVELGHAERIGHGMDVLYEDRPDELLAEMASKHIMVEVNLTSNDVILGVARTDHPLAAYRAAHVPVALSTDDEGVNRIDLTHEYVKGAEEQNLTYADLKRAARTSLEHSFLAGPSLWAASDDFTRENPACAAPTAPLTVPPSSCTAFLSNSEKATQQYELERRFLAFEGSIKDSQEIATPPAHVHRHGLR